jgi:UDP-glucose 4-epimerase
MAISRVIILGSTGLIGSSVLRHLKTSFPEVEVLGRGLDAVDLSDPASAETLTDLLDARTCVVMCAAIKRQLGDSPEIFRKNTEILTTFAGLIARRPVGRVVYLSSAAVYGEDVENLAITEATPTTPRTYYGLSKLTAEWILSKVVDSAAAGSLGLVRPATIYGPGDQPTSYGPSLFLDAAVNGRPVTLWGDGSELRELLYVDDVGRFLAQYALMDHSGPLNLISGTSYTFLDAVAAAEGAASRKLDLQSKPRSKPKVDNRFDPSLLRSLAPDMQFTSLVDGVRLTHAQRYATV